LFPFSGSASEGAFLKRRIDMSNRGIVFVASIALLALAGCATHQGTHSVARSTESDVRPSTLPADLVGTWSGSSVPVGAGPGGDNAVGNVTVAIKDDGTFTATTQRKGSTRNYSGVVVVNGRSVTFRDSLGSSVSLRRRGNVLYGVFSDPTSRHTVQVSVEKDSGALETSPTAQSGR
jgi:hypothetical protein